MKFIFVAILVLATYACGNALPKNIKKISNNKQYITKQITKAQSKKALDYWTPERVKQAITINSNEINEISKDEAQRQGIDIEAAKIISGISSKPIRAVVPHTNNTVFPYSVMGKVLSSYDDPTDGPGTTCSGQYVFNNTYGIILSAGHCTYNCSAGWFFDNFVFYQEYENGKYQLRQIQNVGVLIALCDDQNNYDYTNDYTFIQADPISEMSTIPIDFTDKYDKFVSYGYPNNYGKGAVLESYSGGKGIIQAGKVQMPNNPMDEGSDGGAWLEPNGAVLGVNSFRVKGVAGVWSPEFNNATISLLQYVISEM